MNPVVIDAIRIADKHLAGASCEKRKALALDIQAAIMRHAGNIANDAIKESMARLR